MSDIHNLARSALILVLGRRRKPRRILGGLARGYRIDVSPAEHLSYVLGTNEFHLQKAIREFVSPGDIVYDIGANLGYVSLSLAKRVGTHGRVISFEPLPQNIAAFRRNIEINHLRNVQLLELAASDHKGEAVIRLLENPATASLVWHGDSPHATECKVQTISIDDLVDAGEIPSPKFVKIDVEGAEGAVLQGTQRTLSAAKPVLFIECSEAGRERSWQLLKDLGYVCELAINRGRIKSFDEYRHNDFLWLPPKKA
jgi:FkbM family methyltransferase